MDLGSVVEQLDLRIWFREKSNIEKLRRILYVSNFLALKCIISAREIINISEHFLKPITNVIGQIVLKYGYIQGCRSGFALFWEIGSGSAPKLGSGSIFASASKSKFRSCWGSTCHRGPWTLTMNAWRLKIEPLRVCRPVVADSNHIHEEQDSDLQ